MCYRHSGDAKRLSEVVQAYSSPLEKIKRAVSKLRAIFLMLGKCVCSKVHLTAPYFLLHFLAD